MKFNIKDKLTIQIYTRYFPGVKPTTGGFGADSWYGAPSSDDWWAMMEWARMNCIVCRRGRGTDLIFEREQDVTAFMLRWL